jgi:predicted xylose isomerase-like sugar epimerase
MKRRFAIHTTTIGTSTLLDTIDAAGLAHFDAIEIGDDKLAEHLAAGGTLGDVRQSLSRTGIEAISLSTTEPLALPRGTDDVSALARLHDSLCARAANLGCGTLVVRPPLPMEQVMPKVWHDTVTRTLAGVSRAAAGHGIRVALEFVGTGSSTVRTFAQAREMACAAAPPVGLVLDAFHFHAGASCASTMPTRCLSTASPTPTAPCRAMVSCRCASCSAVSRALVTMAPILSSCRAPNSTVGSRVASRASRSRASRPFVPRRMSRKGCWTTTDHTARRGEGDRWRDMLW